MTSSKKKLNITEKLSVLPAPDHWRQYQLTRMESYPNRVSTFVINAEDATKLLQIKHILPHRTTVSIQGMVTAVSEIIRINKDCVFMIELQGKAVIIVKQPQFHTWHEQLVTGNSFVFTNLRPTSLSEAYQPQQRVFIPWTGSSLYSSAADTSHLSPLELQEWLSHLGLCLPEEENYDMQGCGEEDGGIGVCNSLDFYQGMLTDTSQSEFGIVELENKIRLFLCYLPTLKHPKEVCVGDSVTVHNVHQSVCSQDLNAFIVPVFAQTGKKQLFCCTRSRVNVADKKQQEEPSSDKDSHILPDPAPVMTLLQQFAVSQSDLPSLLKLYQDICQVTGFHFGDKTREKKNRVKKALKYLASSLFSAHRQRNYILEFCQHQTFCPLSMAEESGSSMPQLTSLTGILQDSMTEDIDSQTASGNNSASASSDEDLGWKFTMKVVHNKHLLGWLTTNPATGHLQLSTSQCAMDVVIVSSQTTPGTSPHHCHETCDCSSSLAKEEHSQCPYFHPCCLGHMIMVKNFTVVTEMFLDMSEHSSRVQDQNRKRLSYLVVAAQDCVRLKVGDSQRKCATETSDLSNVSGTDIRLVYITDKCHPVAQTTYSKKRAFVQFCVEGILVTGTNTNTNSDSALAHTSTDTACGNSPPAKKPCRECTASNKQPAFKEKTVSKMKKIDASSSTSQAAQTPCSLPQWLQTGQPVSLTFEEGGCQWFDVIHPPGLYRLVGKEEAAPFQGPQVDAKLQTAIERAGTRMAVKVSASAAVERVFQNCADADVNAMDLMNVQNGQVVSLSSLQSALSDGCPGQLVSFRAMVIWRRHPLSQFPEFKVAARTVGDLARRGQRDDQFMALAGFLDTRNLCVGVKDEKDPSVTTSVYMSFPTLVYPLGLVPGAVVDFHRLERKMSKANNIYFSFLPVSSMCVVSAPSSATVYKSRPPVTQQRTGSRSHTAGWEDTPVWLLVDMWRQPDPPDVFVAACHICQFFRLSLKSVCGQCGALFQPDGCSAPACLNTHHSILFPRFSFLVEDGSCQALVSINKSCPGDVARKLLRMSPTQWQLLESAVQQQGEVFLQKFGCGGGTAVEDLLSLLCDCRKIKRPCQLMLHKPLYSSKPDNKTASMLEALTADDLVTRNINTGEETVETLCLPYLHLDCLDIRDI